MNNLPITEFVNYIYSDECKNKIVYIAIGSAHHMAQNINGIRHIEDKFNQQYPLYIRDLHLNNPDHKLYIILIDPHLETPCFTVANKNINNSNNSNNYDEDWDITKYSNVYENNEDNVVLMEFRSYVSYGDNYNLENSVDINIQLHSLNDLAMIDKWFINVMDYTGRNLYLLAKYFDNFIDSSEKNHIFYGLASRIEGGCYIDLTEKIVYFITNRINGYITAFSPYLYDKKELIEIYKIHNNNNNIESQIIIQQIKIVYKRIIDSFKSEILTIYRRFVNYKKNYTNFIINNNLELYNSECKFIENKYGIKIINNKQDKEQDKEQDIKLNIEENIEQNIIKISQILDDEFNYLSIIFDNYELKDRFEIAKQHIDPYKMYSEICKIVDDFIL